MRRGGWGREHALALSPMPIFSPHYLFVLFVACSHPLDLLSLSIFSPLPPLVACLLSTSGSAVHDSHPDPGTANRRGEPCLAPLYPANVHPDGHDFVLEGGVTFVDQFLAYDRYDGGRREVGIISVGWPVRVAIVFSPDWCLGWAVVFDAALVVAAVIQAGWLWQGMNVSMVQFD